MATINKLGAKSYLASSKNVNRVLTQLNGVLASGNITVAPTVTIGSPSSATIDLSAGNFINITLSTTSGTTTLSFNNMTPGMYYFNIKNGNTTTNNVKFNSSNSTSAYGQTNTNLTCTDLYTFICDGTTLWLINIRNQTT